MDPTGSRRSTGAAGRDGPRRGASNTTRLKPERIKMTIASDTPVLDTLAAITAESVERCGLDDNSLLAARIAALVAVDAPAASYLVHIGPAADAGVTLEQLQGILIAVAPIVGTPRTMSAAARITKALGIAIVAVEAELDAEQAESEYQ